MWDWTSIATTHSETWDMVTRSQLLDFEDKVRYGEVLSSTAKFMGIEFTAYPQAKKLWIRFSPHKLYNTIFKRVNRRGEPMNHDTFTLAKLEHIFRWLEETFEIRPEHCYLHHLEFGVNLRGLTIPTKQILDSLIAYSFKGRQFNDMSVVGNGRGLDLSFTQYRIKLYDKGLQNELLDDTFRFEYKAFKMKVVEDIFGKHARLLDLLEPTFWIRCKDRLLKTLDCCVFDDEFGDIKLEKLTKWRNQREWSTMSPTNRSREKKAFESFIQDYGVLHIKQAIRTGIEAEVQNMLGGVE